MTKQERTKIRRRSNNLYITAYSMVGVTVLMIVLLFTVFPRPEGDATLGYAILVTTLLVVPAVTGLGLGMFAGILNQKLLSESTRILDERNKHKFRLFYELVISKKLDDARKIFNQIVMRDDGYRIFAHGMLIVAMKLSKSEKNQKMADERMDTYLNS